MAFQQVALAGDATPPINIPMVGGGLRSDSYNP